MREKNRIVRKVAVFLTGLSVILATASPSVEAKDFTFSDVEEKTHYYEPITNLAERGIVRGFPGGLFKPKNVVTRGQAAKILAQVVELDGAQVKNPGFKDVPTTNEYYPAIAALVSEGVLTGYEDATFRAHQPVTRAQMAKMLHLAFEMPTNPTQPVPFTDVQQKDWFAEYVHALFVNKITTGTTATTYSPNQYVTRGQLASFAVRAETAIFKKHLTLTTVAGSGGFGEVNGKASVATFRSPTGVRALEDGSILVTDQKSHKIRSIKAGKVATFAGRTFEQDVAGLPIGGLYDDERDGAVFQEPAGLSVDGKGTIYVADAANHAIRKITPTGQVTTLAGTGLAGHKDGGSKEATFYSPQAVAVTKAGDVYVADTLNHVIRKITSTGEVTTLNTPSNRAVEIIPGLLVPAGDFKDGALQQAKFNEPSGLIVDAKGNLYVSDSGNQVIRYIDFSTNTVRTVAGKTPLLTTNKLYEIGGLTNGLAEEATFNFPKGLALSEDGSLLVADSLNHAIRYIRNGKVWTLVEGLNHPIDVSVTKNGAILFTDRDHQLVRQLGEEE